MEAVACRFPRKETSSRFVLLSRRAALSARRLLRLRAGPRCSLDDDGERRFVPLEHDVLRLFEPRISVMPRDGRWPKCLRVQSELGDSWQSFLTFGALADTTVFPGPSAELLFAPLEA